MTDAVANLKRIDEILASYKAGDKGSLVNILHDIQAEFRHLSQTALEMTAADLELSPAEVFDVATFYQGFHLKPRGEHICTVCMGTACHVRGALRIKEQMERDLKISTGQTTADRKFTLQEVNCVGACALGPLVIVDEQYHGNMSPTRLTKLITNLDKQKGNQ